MNLSYCLLILFSFSSLIAMEAPPRKAGQRGAAAGRAASATSRLANASAGFASAAQKKREQAEQEAAGDGLIDGIINDAKDLLGGLFLGPKDSKPEPKKSAQTQSTNPELERLNSLHAQLKKDPTNRELRLEIIGVEISLLGIAAKKIDIIENPDLMLRIMNQMEVLTTQIDEMAPPFAQYPSINLMRPTLKDAQAKVSARPKFSNVQITNAISSLRDAQFKKVNQYNTYAQISAVAALGFVGLAWWKGSKEAAGAAVVCASASLFCAGKKVNLAGMARPTQADAVQFLEQQK